MLCFGVNLANIFLGYKREREERGIHLNITLAVKLLKTKGGDITVIMRYHARKIHLSLGGTARGHPHMSAWIRRVGYMES